MLVMLHFSHTTSQLLQFHQDQTQDTRHVVGIAVELDVEQGEVISRQIDNSPIDSAHITVVIYLDIPSRYAVRECETNKMQNNVIAVIQQQLSHLSRQKKRMNLAKEKTKRSHFLLISPIAMLDIGLQILVQRST